MSPTTRLQPERWDAIAVTPRVLIADDHPPTRAGIKLSLEQANRFEVCAEVATAAAAVEVAAQTLPDVALLDINMPGNGVNAAAEIALHCPNVSVVMLTVSRDDADLFAAVRAGAKGYLLKDIDPARLPFALEGVLAGEAAFPRGLVTRLVDEFRARERRSPRHRGPLGKLTDREWEVLEEMKQGRSTADIAARMFVSQVTVRTHVSAILRKLRVSSRADAVRVAGE
jgi:DNA-binding NarL/FixJ family response regulator